MRELSKSKIEWCDRVWNPVTGCTKVSPGCEHCYAERMSKRFGEKWGLPTDDPFKVTVHPARLDQPWNWKKPRKIFVCSMSDLFHEDVPDEFIFKVFEVMANTQFAHGHIFMVLTKRPKRMGKIIEMIKAEIEEERKPVKNSDGTTTHHLTFHFPLQNIWLGVTAENQEQANKRIPVLLQIPAEKRFVSVEPMLGPVDLKYYFDEYAMNELIGQSRSLDWVICGGESGPGARPMHPFWVSDLRSQCKISQVPFLFKQWGEWLPISQALNYLDEFYYPAPEDDPEAIRECKYRTGSLQLNGDIMPADVAESWGHGAMQTFKIGKKQSGRLLDGQLWDQYPGDRL